MSSDFNYNFCFVVEEWFSSLGILQNLDVSESALKHKHMEKNLGSIRGRQATVDALIGNEHYPTIGAYGRTLIGYENYRNALWLATKTIRRLGLHERESKSLTDGLTYTDDSMSGYASEEAGSHKNSRVSGKQAFGYIVNPTGKEPEECISTWTLWKRLIPKCGKREGKGKPQKAKWKK